MAADVFISCHNSDIDFAKALQVKLEELGIKAWVYTTTRNGAIFKSDIHLNLKSASLAVFIVSPKSMTSAYVAYEYSYARFELSKELYFVYLKSCRNNTGIFGIVKEDDWFPSPCLNDDITQVGRIAEEIKDRDAILRELRTSGEILTSDKDWHFHVEAAAQLASTEHHKSLACHWLFRAIQYELDTSKGYGPVQEAIASALGRVGHLKAMAYLQKLRNFTGDQNVHRVVDKAMSAIADREYGRSLR